MSIFRRSHDQPEQSETNYLASVSDLMAALLFIFVIILTAAVVQMNSSSAEAQKQAGELTKASAEAHKKADELNQATKQLSRTSEQLAQVKGKLTLAQARLIGTQQTRQKLLENIRSRLASEYGVLLDVDPKRGVLRIPESAVTFGVGSRALDSVNEKKLQEVGEVLKKELACFERSFWEAHKERCQMTNPFGNTIDAVFIEGHTDNQGYRGDPRGLKNLTLSTSRSNAVYQVLVMGDADLRSMKNEKGEEIFSISGYGSARPVAGHEHAVPTNDAANRRIELRVILSEPKLYEEEQRLLETFDKLMMF